MGLNLHPYMAVGEDEIVTVNKRLKGAKLVEATNKARRCKLDPGLTPD